MANSKLALYQKKRDFAKTTEPSGAQKIAAAEYPRFVVQKHAATRLSLKQRTGTRLRKAALFQQLGPGLITGAADDDPSGIATYSQAGAQFGFNMLWTMALTYPLMTAVQLVSAQIGRVTGCCEHEG